MRWPGEHPDDRRPAALAGGPTEPRDGPAGRALLARLSRRAARLRRAVLVRRRALAALLLGVAVLAGVRAVAPPPPGVPVLVAARDLPAGATLGDTDVTSRRMPSAAVPDGALDRGAAAGRTLAAPVRRGEPLTDARLAGPGLAAAYPGQVAVPVRLPDPGVAGLLSVGDEVEVLAVGAEDAARTVALARVAGLPRAGADGAGGSMTGGVTGGLAGGVAGSPGGRLVLLAAAEPAARELAAAAAREHLTVVWTR